MPRRRNRIPQADKALARHRRRTANWDERLGSDASLKTLQKMRLLLMLERESAEHEDFLRSRRAAARKAHFRRRAAIRSKLEGDIIVRRFLARA